MSIMMFPYLLVATKDRNATLTLLDHIKAQLHCYNFKNLHIGERHIRLTFEDKVTPKHTWMYDVVGLNTDEIDSEYILKELDVKKEEKPTEKNRANVTFKHL